MQLRSLSEEWKEDYNLNHPHKSFNNNSPLKYLKSNHDILNPIYYQSGKHGTYKIWL